MMSTAVFALPTICPAGHQFEMRRSFSTWRLCLETPTIVLWCYECGLQWEATDAERANVARAVWLLPQSDRPGEEHRPPLAHDRNA